jgi:hypothetical protein
VRPLAQHDRVPHDIRLTAELALPEPVRNDGDVRPSFAIVFGRERRAEPELDLVDLEILLRDCQRTHEFRPITDGMV